MGAENQNNQPKRTDRTEKRKPACLLLSVVMSGAGRAADGANVGEAKPKRSRVGKTEEEVIADAFTDQSLRTEQQRVVTKLTALGKKTLADFDAPFICYHCGDFGTVRFFVCSCVWLMG